MLGRDNTKNASPSSTTRRLVAVLAVSGLIAGAGAILRFACVGSACDEPASATADVPFCGLDPSLRTRIANGFRDGRSPNVMAVTEEPVHGGTVFGAGLGPPWPQTGASARRLPIAFFGTGVSRDAVLPDGMTLDRIAPTISEIIGLERAHPDVRSGTAIEGVADGTRPRLVVVVTVKGAGSDEVSDPSFADLIEREAATITYEGRSPSEPQDPAAMLATIGTGGLPRQHGITGSLLRNDDGRLVKAWGRKAPISVIATLGDDLDESTNQKARIGLVATDVSDQGLIGGNWYIDNDRDDISLHDGGPRVGDVRATLERGYGTDDTTDLVGVILRSGPKLDRSIDGIASAARNASRGSALIVIAGLGPAGDGRSAGDLEDALEQNLGVDVVEATTPGGFFIDQEVLAAESMSEDKVLSALTRLRHADGTRVFSDVFTSIAVSFERYC